LDIATIGAAYTGLKFAENALQVALQHFGIGNSFPRLDVLLETCANEEHPSLIANFITRRFLDASKT
jgi:hypothetical protein